MESKRHVQEILCKQSAAFTLIYILMVYILIYILIYTFNIQTAPFVYQFKGTLMQI